MWLLGVKWENQTCRVSCFLFGGCFQFEEGGWKSCFSFFLRKVLWTPVLVVFPLFLVENDRNEE